MSIETALAEYGTVEPRGQLSLQWPDGSASKDPVYESWKVHVAGMTPYPGAEKMPLEMQDILVATMIIGEELPEFDHEEFKKGVAKKLAHDMNGVGTFNLTDNQWVAAVRRPNATIERVAAA